MLLGVAGRRPKYWWDLGQSIDSDLGGLLGTFVRNSNGLYTNPTTGLITTVGNNIPRFERQGGHLAILDEPEGTNLIHFSHQLGNAASGGWWSNLRLTSVTANGMLAPDGNVVADGLVADANDNSHYIRSQLIGGIARNEKVALTCFVKPGNKDWIWLYVGWFDAASGGIGDAGSYFFNISSGTIGLKNEIGDTTIHDYLIEEAANSYYRIGMIISNNDAATAKCQATFASAHADNDNDFPGDTTTVNTWFWEANLMKQDFFSSPVPTSGATATRATELGYPLWNLPLGLFDAEGMCSIWAYFGYAYDDMPDPTTISVIVTADVDTSLLFGRLTGGLGHIRSFDHTNLATTGLNWAANTWYKLVVKWSSTTLKMRVGYDSGAGIVWGTEVAFDGSYTLGASLRLAYGLFGPMWMRDLRLYDRIPSDSEINSMGSP